MIIFLKNNWVKLLSIPVILAITIMTVMFAFPASAAEDVVPELFTTVSDVVISSWDTADNNIRALASAYFEAVKATGTKQMFHKYSDIPKTWLKVASDGLLQGVYLLEVADDLYYYLDSSTGKLMGYTGHHSGGGGHHYGHAGSGGGAGRNRWVVDDNEEIILDSSSFQEIVNRLSEQYGPKNTGNRHSWQTDKAFVANGYGYISFFSEGTFCNSNLTDVYMLGFYYQGDKTCNYFYGLLQYHFYQTVTQDESGNNVVSLYCDYWDWFNDTDKTTVLISDELATYRYARICARPDGRIIVAWFKTRTDYFKVTNQTQSIITIGTYESKNTYNLNDKSLNTHVTWIEAAREHSGFFSGKDNIESNFISANNADIGYFYSNAPINMGAYDIDFTKMPDDYIVIANGDNIYDYSIVDNSTGDTTIINNYINNNYVFPDNNGGGGSGGGTVNNWNIEFGDFIANITTSIETAITNVFVADVDVINGYNEEIKSAFEDKIPFVSDFKDIFQSLFVDIVDNNFVYAGDIKPEGAKDEDGNLREENILYPSWGFTIDFFGQELELTILDFSMYAEPLYYVRIVVCVFIYVVYFVNLAKALPKLLGNVLDVTDSVSSAVKGGGDS